MNIIDAIINTLRLIGGAVFYIVAILPLALLCFTLSFLLLPIDLIITILSAGSAKFVIFKSFQDAGKNLLRWFSDFV